MKIALVCPYDWNRHGGVQAHVRQLARRLSSDHEVRVIAPAAGPVPRPDAPFQVVGVGAPVPVPFNRSVAAVSLSPAVAARVRRELRRFAPHVTHVHEPLAPVVSTAAVAFAASPLIVTYHAWSDTDRLYRAIGPAARRLVARADASVAVSPAAGRYAAGALGLPLGAFRIVPNGVDVAQFAGAEPIEDLIDASRPLLLFVGRLEPRKGLDVLIRAWLRLRARRPEVRLCVMGEGSERDRCQQMIPPSLRPDVLFVGAVAEAEKARYHASADVYVAPNTGGESFGIVLLEAMSAGLPVVASDIPGFRSVMTDGREGRLVAPGDAPALATALDALLVNDKLRTAMAAEGLRSALDYDWGVVTRRLLDIYHHLVRRSV
jgi:phosphatidylinositol alpha-mannosyltransferase